MRVHAFLPAAGAQVHRGAPGARPRRRPASPWPAAPHQVRVSGAARCRARDQEGHRYRRGKGVVYPDEGCKGSGIVFGIAGILMYR